MLQIHKLIPSCRFGCRLRFLANVAAQASTHDVVRDALSSCITWRHLDALLALSLTSDHFPKRDAFLSQYVNKAWWLGDETSLDQDLPHLNASQVREIEAKFGKDTLTEEAAWAKMIV